MKLRLPHPRLSPQRNHCQRTMSATFANHLSGSSVREITTGDGGSMRVGGFYAFYDYDGEPIYVGQTNERLRTRIRRHLTNQRTDAVALRILDVFEVAAVEVWPIWDLETIPGSNSEAKVRLNSYEYSAYLSAIEKSRFNAILNEKIPPVSPRVDMPESLRWELIDARTRAERGHPDIRLARRAETISRLAAVARERGESPKACAETSSSRRSGSLTSRRRGSPKPKGESLLAPMPSTSPPSSEMCCSSRVVKRLAMRAKKKPIDRRLDRSTALVC